MSAYDKLLSAADTVGENAKSTKGVYVMSSPAVMGSVKGDKDMGINCEYSMWQKKN